MTPRPRRLNAREVEALLRRHGFNLISQRGSHRKWRHPALGLQVIVPEHGNRPLPIGTLFSILKSAEIPEMEWKG